MKAYQYAGLKNLRGSGLGVQECAKRLHHLAYTEERLFLLEAAHIISTPERDLKVLLSRLQYEDAEHATKLKSRLPELRMSSKKAYENPSKELEAVFDEAMHCRSTVELLAALAKVFKPALLQAYRNYVTATNGLADYAGTRIVNSIIADEEDALRVLNEAYRDIVNTPEKEAEAQAWITSLSGRLAAAGGADGIGEKNLAAVAVDRAKTPFVFVRKVTRDDAFPRVWDFEHVDKQKISERLAQMICTRLGEVTIAEALGGVLWEIKGRPWDFYMDLARHLWDEMRHSMFGELAIEDLYGDRRALPLRDFEVAYLFEMKPVELYATLGHVESSLMKYPPGKREEFEFCRDSARYPLMTTLQDFDWADEVHHVHIARSQLKGWYTGTDDDLHELAEKGYAFRARARAQQPAVPLPDVTEQLAAKVTGTFRDGVAPNLGDFDMSV